MRLRSTPLPAGFVDELTPDDNMIFIQIATLMVADSGDTIPIILHSDSVGAYLNDYASRETAPLVWLLKGHGP
jgi:hypothetical protein